MIKRVLTTAMVCLIAAAWPWTAAMAYTPQAYKITVKNSTGTIISDPVSGLTFDSDLEDAGIDEEEAPESSPAPIIKINNTGLAFPWNTFTFDTLDATNPLKVVVVTSSRYGEGTGCPPGSHAYPCDSNEELKAGPNVEGLRHRIKGTKTVSGSTRTYALDFTLVATHNPNNSVTYTRAYELRRIFPSGSESLVSTGTYWIHNPLSVPEPGSLALLLAGAAAGLALRMRRAKPFPQRRN